MSRQSFVDILAGSVITIEDSSYESRVIEGDDAASSCTSLFFPGCSFINYVPSLVQDLYGWLESRGLVDCLSLVCCGKILEYEQDAEAMQVPFQSELVRRIVDSGIKRIVTACPNCVTELRLLLDSHGDASSVEVAPLPAVLCDQGLTITADEVRAVLVQDGREPVDDDRYPQIAFHDSCPDRETGEFAENVRALFPSEILVEKKHNRANSICCGSLANAFGRPDVAASQAVRHGEEGAEAKADSLAVYCMSCARFLGAMQDVLPVHHYLEFMFGTHPDWPGMPRYLPLRFLFDEAHGTRDFCGAVPSE